MTRTPDVLASLGNSKKEHQVLAGFALETHDEINHAQKKLDKKNLDFIVLNSMNDEGDFRTSKSILTSHRQRPQRYD